MKLSCLPVSLFTQIIEGKITVAQWALIGKKYGYDAIDLSILFIQDKTEDELRKIRSKIESIDMSVAMVTTYSDFTNPDKYERSMQLELEKKYIKYASIIGAKALRITAGQAHPNLKRDEGLKWALEGILNCEEIASKNKIQLLLENHGKPGVWNYPDFDQDEEIFLELADALKDSSIKINFDTANPIVGQSNVTNLMEKVIDQIGWIHIADTDNKNKLNHVVIGTGLVPFKDVFIMLKKHGYDGWLSVEEGSGLEEKGIALAADFVRQNWNKI